MNFTAQTVERSPRVDCLPPGRAQEGATAIRRPTSESFPLWMHELTFGPAGGSIAWIGEHGDDAVYVHEGELLLGNQSCVTTGATIVDSGVLTTATVVGAARLSWFGAWNPDPPVDGPLGPADPHGRTVHVVDPSGRFTSGDRTRVWATWFSDGTLPTSRAQLLLVQCEAENNARGHTHSQDEIIAVIGGGIHLGAHHYAPGAVLSIPGNARYALRGLPGGHAFLNFRRDVSWQTYERGSEPILETAASRGGQPTRDDLRKDDNT